MNTTIIKNHNEVVKPGDIVVHAGDFTLEGYQEAKKYIDQLNGTNIFLKGSHDYWLQGQPHHEIWEKTIEGQHIVVCHYAMRVWPKSHYGSFLCYGHSHGKLLPIGKSWDVGVDNNGFYPVSFEQLKILMELQPDNPNLIKN
jgi:calcineurin-like phosphoesterase family protein